MFFIKSTDNLSKHHITIDNLNTHVPNCNINIHVKLMLIFSLKKCQPCIKLTEILDELFDNASKNLTSLPLQVIKFDYENLSQSDKSLLEVFPTTFVINPDQLQSIGANEPLINYAINNCKVYQGQLQKLCDDHNLISF
jgi:hypothetical protein